MVEFLTIVDKENFRERVFLPGGEVSISLTVPEQERYRMKVRLLHERTKDAEDQELAINVYIMRATLMNNLIQTKRGHHEHHESTGSNYPRDERTERS